MQQRVGYQTIICYYEQLKKASMGVDLCPTPIIPKDTREMRRKLETETEKKATKQQREMRKTGGGATPGDLTAFWGMIIGIIGNTPIDGIPGGIDMGDDDEESSLCEIEYPGPSHEVDFDEMQIRFT